MGGVYNPRAAAQAGPALPRPLFPLVRHLSARITPLLIKADVRPNPITYASLFVGVASAVLFSQGTAVCDGLGAVVFILYAVLDCCDGEVARLTGSQSDHGKRLDQTVDWLVHSVIFLALGAAASSTSDNVLWLWCAALAVVGLTAEYILRWLLSRRVPSLNPRLPHDTAGTFRLEDLQDRPTWSDRLTFVLRHLMEKDFCFILALFVLLDATWILLAGAAVGMQVYWLAGLYRRGRAFHV